MLTCVNSREFLSSLVISLFNSPLKLSDPFHILVASNDVLEVLQKTSFILILSFGLHETDLFNLTLENQEAIVLQIDAFGTEKITHILER